MTKPFFSVVINTCDRANQVRTLLATLERQTYPDFEVVVVVGPTRDDTREMLTGEFGGRVAVADCAEFNLAASRNVGLRTAAGDVLAFIDDDAVPCNTWLEQLAGLYEPGIDGVGGRTYLVRGGDGELQFVAGWTSVLAEQRDVNWSGDPPAGSPTPREFWFPRFHGCNMSYRRDALFAIGGFDERLVYLFEDSDIGVRMGRAGKTLRHSFDAVVYHAAATGRNRGKKGRFDLNWYDWLRAQIYFTLRHGVPTVGYRRALVAAARHFSNLSTLITDVRGYDEIDAGQERAARSALRRALRRALVEGLVHGPRMAERLESSRREPVRFQEAESRRRAAVPPIGVGGHGKLVHLNAPPLSVAILSIDYPPRNTHGVARLSHLMARGLAELGHEVHVVTAGRGPRVTYDDAAYVHETAQPVPPRYRRFESAGCPNLAAWLDSSHAAWDVVQSIARNDGVDVVDTALWNLDGLVAAMDGRFPLVVRTTTAMKQIAAINGDERLEARLLGELEADLLRRADAVVSSCRESADTVRRVYGVDLDAGLHAIVPYGIVPAPDAEVEAVSRAAEARGDDLRILFVGRLEARKGILDLFEAIPAVLAEHPRSKFVIAGGDNSVHDGFRDRTGMDYADSFRETHPNLAGRVEFKGHVDEATLDRLYRDCDLFVAPSHYESFGLIYLEAMNYAKPVIGCAAGGPKEIIVPGETGALVPVSDPAALAAAISRFAGDRPARRRAGDAGRARLLDRYTHLAMARGFVELYRRAIAGRDQGAR